MLLSHKTLAGHPKMALSVYYTWSHATIEKSLLYTYISYILLLWIGRLNYTQMSLGPFLFTRLHHTVNIFDRCGNLKSKVTLQGSCSGMDWDKDGDILAVVEDRLTCVYLWNSHSFELTTLDTGFKWVQRLWWLIEKKTSESGSKCSTTVGPPMNYSTMEDTLCLEIPTIPTAPLKDTTREGEICLWMCTYLHACCHIEASSEIAR